MSARFLSLSLGCVLALPMNADAQEFRDRNDSLFFAQNHELITATWHAPFSYTSKKSSNAPLGPYMGNGDVGVVAFTSDNSQTLKISKVDFVTDGWTEWSGTGPSALPVGGVSVRVDLPVYSGFDSTGEPCPSGFNYQMDQLQAELRMTTNTSPRVNMTSWMSPDKNIIVTELAAPSSFPISISVDTYAEGPVDRYATTAAVRDGLVQVTRRTKTDGVRWVCRAGISTRIIGAEASHVVLGETMARSNFRLPAGDTVYVVTCVSGGGKGDDARLEEARGELAGLTVAGIGNLKAAKRVWWEDMWARSYVDTHDELLNRHYLSSIYLLASGYNRHSPVCGGMYGVWNMEDAMNYHGDIHLNYNSQAGFYSVFSANRPELALPFYKSIELLVPEGRRRAREEMGKVHPSLEGKVCDGILFPVSALGIGEFYCQYWQQTMNAPFCVPIFAWYYDYTGDLTFLRDRAYPYIRLVGDFYESYIRREDFNGSYRYCITTGGHENSWDLNPPAELAFVEQTFRLLLQYSRVLGVDKQRRAKWEDIVTHLPAYKVIMPTKEPNAGKPVYAKNEAGWDLPSHVIQLHCAYPCELLNLNSDPEALQIARNTLQYYQVDQNGFTGTMNELGLSSFVMGARIGFDPQVLIDNMKKLIATARPNLLIVDGHHCAEKTTVIETVNSMMLQSIDGVLHFFPCWPGKPASFTRLRAKGAFVVSASYDGREVSDVQITGEKDAVCRIANPWPGCRLRVTIGGKSVRVKTEGNICSFAVRPGQTYHVGREDRF